MKFSHEADLADVAINMPAKMSQICDIVYLKQLNQMSLIEHAALRMHVATKPCRLSFYAFLE